MSGRKEKLIELGMEKLAYKEKTKSERLMGKLTSKAKPKIFGESDRLNIEHSGRITPMEEYAGRDKIDVESSDYANQQAKAKRRFTRHTLGSGALGGAAGVLSARGATPKQKALAGLGGAALGAGLGGTASGIYNRRKMIKDLPEDQRKKLKEILRERSEIVADDLGQADDARGVTEMYMPGVGYSRSSRGIRPHGKRKPKKSL